MDHFCQGPLEISGVDLFGLTYSAVHPFQFLFYFISFHTFINLYKNCYYVKIIITKMQALYSKISVPQTSRRQAVRTSRRQSVTVVRAEGSGSEEPKLDFKSNTRSVRCIDCCIDDQ